MDRKKELKKQYLESKPEMGIFIIRSKLSNKCFIQTSKDLKSTINRTNFQLNAGNHPNRELQNEWNNLGSEKFIIETIENLEYDSDESKTDYSEELTLMQMIWEERLLNENKEFYKK